MQNREEKDLLAIITGNPSSNEKVETLPENLLRILFVVVRFLHREPVIYVFYFQILNPPRWEIEEEN